MRRRSVTVRGVARRGGLLLSDAGNALLSGSAPKRVGISTQAPPDGNIGGSRPIYFPLLYLRDDGEVFGCGSISS